jgi:hypothetical protein
MTGISLHMQWPLTSQSHGSVSQREQLVDCELVYSMQVVEEDVGKPKYAGEPTNR